MPVTASPQSRNSQADRVIPRAVIRVDAAHVVQEASDDAWLIQSCEADLLTIDREFEGDHVRVRGLTTSN